MWIVRLALRRPYTFVVMAVLIAILGASAIITMPTDIFPYIDIPVVSVVWTYSGLSPEEMEKRMVTIFERSLTTTVNDIEHIESQSYSGVSVTRVYFQADAKVEVALSQITAISQTLLKIFPPGTTPPSIIKYDASSVPILQLGMESKTLSEQEVFDLGQNFIRTQLATIRGAAVPLPYGGKFRQVMVDINPEQLYAKQLAPADVSNALATQNLILPAGNIKIGSIDYQVKLNNSPRVLAEMNRLPIKIVNGATVYLGDVAQVRDGYSVQTSIVRANGSKGEASNESGLLMPGMYAQVDLSVPRKQPPLVIPGDTLVMRANGPQVAIVNSDGMVHFQLVQLGRDFGDRLEVLSGLQEGDHLAVNPSDAVREGIKVKPVIAKDKGQIQ